MKKDFKNWHDKKSIVDNISKRPSFHEGDIWWCILGINIGYEQDGSGANYLRPVVIIKKFNNDIFLAIPLTHTQKKTKFYFRLSGTNSSSTAILSQIKLVDAKRLSHKMGGVPQKDLDNLIKKFKVLLP